MRPLVGVALLVVAVACGGAAPPEPAAEPSPVYELRPDPLPTDPGCEDEPSCRIARFVVWVAPEPGWVRTDWADETGFETVRTFAHGVLATSHGEGSAEVRAGSPAFVGRPIELRIVDAVRAAAPLEPGERVGVRYPEGRVTFVVRTVGSLDDPAAARLFAIPESAARSSEVAPGTPSDVVGAYWLGPRHGTLDAVSAVERDAADGRGYFVFYGGGPEAPDALQIASTPASDPEARALDSTEGRPVTLAGGERARLVAISAVDDSYAVVTDSTIVGFTATTPGEAQAIARALRRVPAG